MTGAARAAGGALILPAHLLLGLLASCAGGCSAPPAWGDLGATSDLERRALVAEEWIERGHPKRALAVLGEGADYLEWCRSGSAGVRAGRAWQEASLALGRVDEVNRRVQEGLREETPEGLVLAARLAPTDAEALRLLERAQVADSELEWAPYGLGVLLAKDGASRAALERLDKAIEIAPSFFEALRARSFLKERIADFDGAAEDGDKALAVRPGSVEVRLFVASIEHRERMRPAWAAVHYRAALDVEPGRPEALLGLAACFEERGDLSQAERLYRHVAPKEPLAWFDLGLLYENRLSDPERALEAYRRFLEIDPPRGSAAESAQLERWVYAPLRVRALEEQLAGGSSR